jgi:hypothetical protein
VAAICEHLKIPTKMVAAHREWAPTRKPDPHSLDMDKFREWVEEARAGGPAKAKPPPQQKANIIFEIGRVTVSQKKNELEPVDRRKAVDQAKCDIASSDTKPPSNWNYRMVDCQRLSASVGYLNRGRTSLTKRSNCATGAAIGSMIRASAPESASAIK